MKIEIQKVFGMKNIFLLIVVMMANNGFDLINVFHSRNSFNEKDIGFFLLWLSLPFVLVFNRDPSLYKSRFFLLIVSYLLFVLLHIGLCGFYYDQSLLDGAIACRMQFYYLFYFICMLFLRDTKSIFNFLELLTLVSVIISILALIHYFYPVIFYQQNTLVTLRSGVRRMYVPGMWLVCFSAIWVFCKFQFSGRNKLLNGVVLSLLISVLLFRQTRSLIFGFILVTFFAFFINRKIFQGVALVLVLFLSVFVVGELTGGDISGSLYESTTNDLVNSEGTWGTRLGQAEFAWQVFKENPILGSGGVAIRMKPDEVRSSKDLNLSLLAYIADLGYFSWLKSFGLLGIVWLAYFYFVLTKKLLMMMKTFGRRDLMFVFCSSFMIFVAFTFVTINYLMYPQGIVLIVLFMVMIERFTASDYRGLAIFGTG